MNAITALDIPYYIGGSVASSLQGAPRTTMDVDIVCELNEQHAMLLLAAIPTVDFYFSEASVRDAVRRHSCFNLIHLKSSFKVDVFVSKQRPFDRTAMRRAEMINIGDVYEVLVRVASPEDIILAKLEWYKLTNETSERHWNDIERLIDVQGDRLDKSYLRTAAMSIGVEKLLGRLARLNLPND